MRPKTPPKKPVTVSVSTVNGSIIEVYGSNKWYEISHEPPDLEDAEEHPEILLNLIPTVTAGKECYRLDDFLHIDQAMKDEFRELAHFDGITNDSYYSGQFIQVNEYGDEAKVLNWISRGIINGALYWLSASQNPLLPVKYRQGCWGKLVTDRNAQIKYRQDDSGKLVSDGNPQAAYFRLPDGEELPVVETRYKIWLEVALTWLL